MRWALALLSLMALGGALGCARFPEGGTGARTIRLTFRLETSQPINPNFVYIVALRPSVDPNPTTNGPVPVIAPPWGNGFVAGNVTHFVRWDQAQAPDYLLYQFQDVDLLQWTAIGVPISFLDVTSGSRVIQFELDLTQLVPATEVSNFRSLQVNFLTMDRVPQGGSGDKNWDALGDSRLPSGINQFVTIPLQTSGTYDNDRFLELEPPNDVADPSLDLVDWSVEVRRL